jgi:chaperonin cofactor prefoldin
LAEVKSARDEVKAKASEIKVLEDQLQRAKEQLNSAQMTIASMVSRSELTAAETLLNDLQLLMKANEERSSKSVDCLQEQAREYKSEIDELKAAIQANCAPYILMH